jgi:NADH:ubiquinone oxidoreductase subunit 3 (subunit A)
MKDILLYIISNILFVIFLLIMQLGMFLLGYGIKNHYQSKKKDNNTTEIHNSSIKDKKNNNIDPFIQIIIGLLLICFGIIIMFIFVRCSNIHI